MYNARLRRTDRRNQSPHQRPTSSIGDRAGSSTSSSRDLRLDSHVRKEVNDDLGKEVGGLLLRIDEEVGIVEVDRSPVVRAREHGRPLRLKVRDLFACAAIVKDLAELIASVVSAAQSSLRERAHLDSVLPVRQFEAQRAMLRRLELSSSMRMLNTSSSATEDEDNARLMPLLRLEELTIDMLRAVLQDDRRRSQTSKMLRRPIGQHALE